MLEDDTISNPTDSRPFEDILGARLSRRSVLVGSAATAALTFFGTGGSAAQAAPPIKRPIRFTSIPMQNGTWPTIAPEYDFYPFIPWREKLDGSGTSYDYEGFTAEQQENSIGIGHDGMWYFGNNRSGVLCVNHEFGTTPHVLGAPVPASIEDVRLMQAAHGISVVKIAEVRGQWKVRSSRNNRRITVNTPVAFAGPAANSPLLVTPAGNAPAGTLNNCANGYTPWGTYITCEENFNGYFGATGTLAATPEQARYGLSANGFGYAWHQFDPRFDLTNGDSVNEENRFGWVVEIDPNKPDSLPVKRTALGRVKHEGAGFAVGKGQRVVVYMGDDERFEYIYKFVSAGNFRSMLAQGKSPLDEGTLYVARFDEDGTGEWLELSPNNPTLADWSMDRILVYTRLAADAVGATRMDRPEWTSVGKNEEVFCTLTNNSRRTAAQVNASNPQGPNTWGHIIRWVDSDQHTGTTFEWDLFALATEVTDENGQMFGSPDGLWADPDGRIFVQTDGAQPGGNNDQMLVADPTTAEFRRLFTGVAGCEVTGIAQTPNRRVMFVNLQHPGDGDPNVTNWPEPFTGAEGPVPRDSTVVIVRKDGGVVGS